MYIIPESSNNPHHVGREGYSLCLCMCVSILNILRKLKVLAP